MKLTLYSHPKCTTCKKAVKFLNDQKINFEEIAITEHPPTKKELEAMLNNYDGQVRRLFNTSGMQYRSLNLKEKLPTLTKDEAIEILANDGMLVKRPFALKGNVGVVGFKEDEWREKLV